VKVRFSELRVGRVLHEDDDFVTLEVVKDEQRQLQVEDGDRYLTLVFVKHSPTASDPGRLKAWLPWLRADSEQ
jgi:hypothetical protein